MLWHRTAHQIVLALLVVASSVYPFIVAGSFRFSSPIAILIWFLVVVLPFVINLLLIRLVVRTWAGNVLLALVTGSYLVLIHWCLASKDGFMFIALMVGAPAEVLAAVLSGGIDLVIQGMRTASPPAQTGPHHPTPKSSEQPAN